MEVYSSGPPEPSVSRIKVGIADLGVAGGGEELVTSGLGSCIAVAVYDASSGVAGLAHAMLPRANGDPATAKFVDTATDALLDEVRAAGGSPGAAEAKLVGGSQMFEFSSEAIGPRNVDAARRALAARGVPVVASDVGGDYGRSVRLDGATGELVVRSAKHGEDVV